MPTCEHFYCHASHLHLHVHVASSHTSSAFRYSPGSPTLTFSRISASALFNCFPDLIRWASFAFHFLVTVLFPSSLLRHFFSVLSKLGLPMASSLPFRLTSELLLFSIWPHFATTYTNSRWHWHLLSSFPIFSPQFPSDKVICLDVGRSNWTFCGKRTVIG